MNAEHWKPVVGAEGFYEVSNLGNMRSLDREVTANGTTYVRKGRALRSFVDSSNGYVYVNISISGRVKKRAVHVMVLESFVGPRPDGQEACHADGDRANPKLSNLRWDTPSANWADKRAHGRATAGEQNARAKLTESDVAEILASADPSHVAAKRYGVASSTIRAVRCGQNWKRSAA